MYVYNDNLINDSLINKKQKKLSPRKRLQDILGFNLVFLPPFFTPLRTCSLGRMHYLLLLHTYMSPFPLLTSCSSLLCEVGP